MPTEPTEQPGDREVDTRRTALVGATAAQDVGDLDPALLGDFVAATARAAAGGHRLRRSELVRYRERGTEAARRGVPLRALVDLYLSAAWRLWRELPAVGAAARDPQAVVRAGEAMLRASADAVASLTEGYQLTRRGLVRQEEAARREFVDDLLLGRADASGLVDRAAGYGLDLSGPHAVAVARAEHAFHDGSAVMNLIERAVLGSKGDADVLVTSKNDQLVVVFAAPDHAAIEQVADQLSTVLGRPPSQPGGVQLHRHAEVGVWRLAMSRARRGAAGVRSCLDEARSVLDVADRLELTGPVVDGADLLVYQVLLRDQLAMSDLVTALLGPLLTARGGAEPLLETLRAYFAAGGNSSQAARTLHLSVRALTYRLERIADLTGYDPAQPDQRFALQAAVLGARLLGWPSTTSL